MLCNDYSHFSYSKHVRILCATHMNAQAKLVGRKQSIVDGYMYVTLYHLKS